MKTTIIFQHSRPCPVKDVAEALDILSGANHCLLTVPACLSLAGTLGIKIKETDIPVETVSRGFKELNYCEDDHGNALPFGTRVRGWEGSGFTSMLCRKLKLDVIQFLGRGYQHRANMDALRMHFQPIKTEFERNAERSTDPQ